MAHYSRYTQYREKQLETNMGTKGIRTCHGAGKIKYQTLTQERRKLMKKVVNLDKKTIS